MQMTKSGLSKSTRKFVRLQKSLIRRQFSDTKKQEEMIGDLYKKLLGNPMEGVKKETVVMEDTKGKSQSSKVKTTGQNLKSKVVSKDEKETKSKKVKK